MSRNAERNNNYNNNNNNNSSNSRRTIISMVAALVLLFAGKSSSSFSFRLTPQLHLQKAVGRRLSPSSLFSKMSSSSIPKLKQLEVEQKFPFSDQSDLEERLRREGFAPLKELTMVDWYFDRFVDDDNDAVNNNSYLELPLVRRDHWLRYRETIIENGNGNGGQWQLKRGGNKGGGATVYEEIEGIQAVDIAHSVLKEQQSPPLSSRTVTTLTFDGHPIPVLPIPDCDVVPLARIVTHRAKWKQEEQHQPPPTKGNANVDDNKDFGSKQQKHHPPSFPNLVVDLDTTPDGYAVGEVEAVVEGEDCNIDIDSATTKEAEAAAEGEALNDRAVARARADIQRFLARLFRDDDNDNGNGNGNGNGEDYASSSATNRRPPMGKLEQFLSQNRPRIYKACFEAGVIPKPPPPTTTAPTTQ
jgi:hypothetical protein